MAQASAEALDTLRFFNKPGLLGTISISPAPTSPDQEVTVTFPFPLPPEEAALLPASLRHLKEYKEPKVYGNLPISLLISSGGEGNKVTKGEGGRYYTFSYLPGGPSPFNASALLCSAGLAGQQ